MGLPMDTMSGITLSRWNAHQLMPMRAKPPCTSSAMNSPPRARTRSAARVSASPGSAYRPSLANTVSTMSAATGVPAASSSSAAASTLAANLAATSCGVPSSRQGAGMVRTCAPTGRSDGDTSASAIVTP